MDEPNVHLIIAPVFGFFFLHFRAVLKCKMCTLPLQRKAISFNTAVYSNNNNNKSDYGNFKNDLAFEDTKFTSPTQDFYTAAVTNKGKTGNWNWWFSNVNYIGNSKSLMDASNIVYNMTTLSSPNETISRGRSL